MKSRPILFSAPMVLALRDGSKTQTRRISKTGTLMPDGGIRAGPCPYGVPGDQLWTRESYFQKGNWEPVEGVKTKKGRQKWKFVPTADTIIFDIKDCGGNARLGRCHQDPSTIAWHKRLARFMPRWASRDTLEIKWVSIERLNDISEPDAMAEGCRYLLAEHEYLDGNPDCYRQLYRILWEQINGPGSWNVNPWVWVIEFKRL